MSLLLLVLGQEISTVPAVFVPLYNGVQLTEKRYPVTQSKPVVNVGTLI